MISLGISRRFSDSVYFSAAENRSCFYICLLTVVSVIVVVVVTPFTCVQTCFQRFGHSVDRFGDLFKYTLLKT